MDTLNLQSHVYHGCVSFTPSVAEASIGSGALIHDRRPGSGLDVQLGSSGMLRLEVVPPMPQCRLRGADRDLRRSEPLDEAQARSPVQTNSSLGWMRA